MKLLVTILQHRRVVLPHLFVKYTVPMMREKIDVEVHIVQHMMGENTVNYHESSLLPVEKEILVSRWTEAGRYADAVITRHAQNFPKYPSIPSRRIAIEFALSNTYDLHLCLEDDAIVHDPYFIKWDLMIQDNIVAAFKRNKFGYINSAYYISRPEFDLALLPLLRDQEAWNLSSSIFSIINGSRTLNLLSPRIEPVLTRIAGGRIAQLEPKVAARFNGRKTEACAELKELVMRVCPDDMFLLNIDFPENLWH